ncbi:MAG: FKBP-type peptidyl-prolyl cis-trans isomerase [Muribaculaceae bacterium]|nr:FKBP-type peptidyl-prolyl cis-trans isomerase [Muribaculaceae bacterium]
MKKFLYTVIMAVMAITMLDSCLGTSLEDEYKDWREKNEAWFQQQASSGQYTMLTAPWDPSAKTLIRWHNDTMLTKGNLKPLITSTVDVKYHLSLYDGSPVDSSYVLTSPADSVYRTVVKQTVEGWMIALTRMHVGDSCTVIVPYPQGYGSTKMSDLLVPYSTLVFDVKLVDIYKYKAN